MKKLLMTTALTLAFLASGARADTTQPVNMFEMGNIVGTFEAMKLACGEKSLSQELLDNMKLLVETHGNDPQFNSSVIAAMNSNLADPKLCDIKMPGARK